jgi:hypothetical protein
MNILFDHQIFYMEQYGGVSRYFYEIANRIAETEENKVEIFAPLYVNEYFRNDCMIRPQGIKIPLLPRSGRVMAAVNTTISQLRVRSRGDVDI